MLTSYEKLVSERDRLQARVNQINDMLTRYDDLEREAASLFGGAATAATAVTTDTEGAYSDVKAKELEGRANTTHVTPTPIREFEDFLRQLMKDTNKPLTRNEIMGRLDEQNVVVGGKSPLNTLGTRLSRLEWIVNLKGYGYWLRERHYAPAGHEPGDLDVGLGILRPVEDGEESDPATPGFRFVSKKAASLD